MAFNLFDRSTFNLNDSFMKLPEFHDFDIVQGAKLEIAQNANLKKT